MAVFVVERELPGITPEALMSAGLRARTCCTEMTQEGQSVMWLRSFFAPENSTTCCYFQAASKEEVEEANKRANIPFVNIREVMELTPDQV